MAESGPIEAEVKARVDDAAAAGERLRELGAEHVATVEQADRYLDHPARSFADTDEALRVRVEDGEAELTYKGAKLDEATKSRRELEVALGDAETAVAILEALGFAPQPVVRKRREVYAWDGVTATVDRVEGVGVFVELERVVDEDELDAAREELLERAERLGVGALERRSYLEMLLEEDPAEAG